MIEIWTGYDTVECRDLNVLAACAEAIMFDSPGLIQDYGYQLIEKWIESKKIRVDWDRFEVRNVYD